MKCNSCKKRTIIFIKCKCNIETCISCKDPDIHNCPIDYFQKNKEKLQKELIKVVPTKIIDKI